MGTVNLTIPHFANRSAFKKGIISDLFCIVGFFGVSGVSVLTHLTVKPLVGILSVLSPHVAVGILTPRIGAKTPLSLTVFLCSSFSMNAALIRVLFSMVDCFRGALCPARAYTGSEKPNSAESHSRYEVNASDKARQDKQQRIKNPRT